MDQISIIYPYYWIIWICKMNMWYEYRCNYEALCNVKCIRSTNPHALAPLRLFNLAFQKASIIFQRLSRSPWWEPPQAFQLSRKKWEELTRLKLQMRIGCISNRPWSLVEFLNFESSHVQGSSSVRAEIPTWDHLQKFQVLVIKLIQLMFHETIVFPWNFGLFCHVFPPILWLRTSALPFHLSSS